MGVSFCFDLLSAYPLKRILPGLNEDVGIGAFAIGLFYFFNSLTFLVLIWWQRRSSNANEINEGTGSSRMVIFPIYTPFLICSFLADMFVGMIFLLNPTTFHRDNGWTASVLTASVYAFQHFVIEGIAFSMLQYGCGYQALRRSAVLAGVWAATTFLIELLVFREGGTAFAEAAGILWNGTLLLFYLLLWLAPQKYIYRRSSILMYAKFWAIFRVVLIISEGFIWWSQPHGSLAAIGNCIYVIGNLVSFAALKPYIIYMTLLRDSIWWQGTFSSHNPVDPERQDENDDGTQDKPKMSAGSLCRPSNRQKRQGDDGDDDDDGDTCRYLFNNNDKVHIYQE